MVAPQKFGSEQKFTPRKLNNLIKNSDNYSKLEQKFLQLKNELEPYRIMFDKTNQDWVWIWSFNTKGRILSVSKNSKKITGLAPNELIGKDEFELELIPKEYYEYLHKNFLEHLRGRTYHWYQKQYYPVINKKTGKIRFFEANSIPLKKNGEVIGMLTIAHNITRAKKAEENIKKLNKNLENIVRSRTKKLAETNKRLKQALEDKVIFFQKASHQLRTPLTVIKGNLEFVSTEAKKEPEFELINYEINKLAQIVSDFSYLATDDQTKKEHMRKEQVDWKELVAHVSRELAYESKVYGIAVAYAIHARRVYHGEPYYLSKLLHHLLSNAIKFSTAESHVSLTIADTKQGVAITCQDHGIGISSIHLKKIFDKFYKIQFDSHKTKHDGSGLGLTICKSVVDLHDGKITITSRLGEGTIIKILLPSQKNMPL